jgi:hypothetical protein
MSGSMRATALKAATEASGPPVSSDLDTLAVPEARQCPTRSEGQPPLFQHRVTANECQNKQRKLYHKCFTCVHVNGRR